jgi:hypothetical protein
MRRSGMTKTTLKTFLHRLRAGVAVLPAASMVPAATTAPAAALVAAASIAAVSPASAQEGDAHLLLITGISGEERFARSFAEWGAALTAAAVEKFDMKPANVVWLAESTAVHARVKDRSTRPVLERELRALASRAGEHDRILIIYFGHGSYQRGETRINLPGPDINGTELAALLEPLRTQRVAVVNAASSSGGFIQDLAAPNRVVITATRSGMESNETIFGAHFTAALVGTDADVDQDGRVSLLEAFDYARREVEREYQRTNRLQTEHAMLDGVGDGRGVSEVERTAPHGRLARAFFLGPVGGAAAATASPELRALYEARDRLQSQLDELRGRRSGMEEAAYEQALERLLIEIARNAQEIRRIEGGG